MTQATREDRQPMTSYALAIRKATRGDAQLAQFQFPGDEPGDADKTLELRGRAPAAATQEIDAADVLEVEPIDHHPSSVHPVSLDVVARPTRARAILDAEPRKPSSSRSRPRRVGWGLGAAIFGTGCLVLAIVNATRASAQDSATPKAAAVAASPVPVTAPAPVSAPGIPATASQSAPAAGGVPSVSVNNLPRVAPTTGTIRLIEAAAAHRLWIDGNLQNGTSAVVSCGKHLVKVGSAGTAHAMIIACGEETVIAR